MTTDSRRESPNVLLHLLTASDIPLPANVLTTTQSRQQQVDVDKEKKQH